MRKDTKTGMIAGSILCFVAIIWFCAKEQVVRPITANIEPETEVSQTTSDLSAIPTVSMSASKPTEEATEEPSYKNPIQPVVTEPIKPVIAKQAKPAETEKSDIIHTVLSGQTLSDISKIYYGSANKWRKIYEANKKQFPRGPDAIKPGMKIVIPQ